MNVTKTGSVTFSLGRIASLACLLEVMASKPGNVHRGADFEDLSLNDFVVSAEILGQTIDSRKSDSVGKLIRETVQSTRTIVGTNTNLGIALLVCPLVMVAAGDDLIPSAVQRQLKRLTSDDARQVYEAIRIAQPGGLGTSPQMDVADTPPEDLLMAMQHASERDLVAQQYTNNFEQIFQEVVPLLVAGQTQFGNLGDGIIYAHVSLLARYGDSLIERKCGLATSETARTLARKALQQLLEGPREAWYEALADLDFWMRSDGHRRNPGTTADLITAGIFVGLVNEKISPPFV